MFLQTVPLFTLLELMIVVGIIGLLAAMFFGGITAVLNKIEKIAKAKKDVKKNGGAKFITLLQDFANAVIQGIPCNERWTKFNAMKTEYGTIKSNLKKETQEYFDEEIAESEALLVENCDENPNPPP